jgi:phosphonopyruvate decarboxylase
VITRYQAIERLAAQLAPEDLVVSTTGMISRELFAAADRPGNCYLVGSMGLASALGLGLALLRPDRRVFVLDGDGSALMSLGNLPHIAAEAPANLFHVVLDNESYESTGAQPTVSASIDFVALTTAAGYRDAERIDAIDALDAAIAGCTSGAGPRLLHIKVAIAPSDVPRVSHTPEEIRDRFRGSLMSAGEPSG